MKKKCLFLLLIVNQLIYSQCLDGNYTIGGASPSFTSINQAVSSLTVNGVCGSVTFNLRPGTYNERIIIPQIVGTSSLNTITFQSESLDSSSVVIQEAGASSTPYVVKLDGADFITFKNLTVKNTDANYSCVLYILNTATNFKLSNSIVEAPVTLTNGSNFYKYLINSATTTNAGFVVENTKINGAQRGIYCTSTLNVRISNNVIFNQNDCALFLLGVTSPTVSANIITGTAIYSGYKGIYLSSCTQAILVEKNFIDQAAGTGITSLFQSTGSGVYSKINNNRINLTGTSNQFGIYLQNGSNYHVYHNTVVITNTFVLSACLRYEFSLNNIVTKNNIFYQKASSYAMAIGTSSSVTNVVNDYNDIYSEGTFCIVDGINKTFNDWQALGYDSNSLNYKPQFVSSTDLHIASDFSQNILFPYLSEVPTDMEGTIRDNTSPYFGAYEYFNTSPLIDAGVKKVVMPNVICSGAQPINVLLKNYSSNSLNSATINWSVNGLSQTPFSWNGNLNYYDTTLVNVGNFNFVDLGSYVVKAWTSNPNGSTDDFIFNDTVKSSNLYTALSGNYTVGGSVPTFSNITVAITNLKNRGVCGNVILNLRNGVYTETADLSGISGLGGSNFLTIQSESGVKTNVIVTSAATSTVSTFQFSGTNSKNIILKNISIGSTSLSSSPIKIYEGVTNLEINSCIINGANQFSIYSNLTTGNVNGIKILNNTFNSGQYSIYLNGTASYKFYGVKINNNLFTANNSGRVAINYSDSIEFQNNIGVSTTTVQAFGFSNNNYVKLLSNKVSSKDVCPFTVAGGNGGIIANNMISFQGVGADNGLFISNINNLHVVNNSINCTNTNSSSIAMYFYNNLSSSNRVWNNIFQNTGPGLAIRIANFGMYLPRFKNNAYYSKGNKFGIYNSTNAVTLENWKTISNTDTNSVVLNPYFNSDIDLHVNEILLKNAGLPIVDDITTDFDGQTRNISNPDIGADEFTSLANDASAARFDFNSMLCEGIAPVQVYLKNNGISNLTSAKLNWKINASTLTQVNWSGNLAPGNQTLVTLGNYTFTLNTPYSLKSWSTLPNGVTDLFRANDTTYQTYTSPALTGTFTIGGTSPTYTSISQAFTALKNAGQCGPVVYKIRNGVYNDQIYIPNIKGNSSVNTIFIESETQDSSLVSIEFNSTSSANNYIVMVDSTDYIVFSKLGFKPLNSTYSQGFYFSNKTSNIKIKNCLITGQLNSGSLVGFSANCDSSEVSGCKFINGYRGIVFNGIGNIAQKNSFQNQSAINITSNGNYLQCLSNQITNSNSSTIGININSSYGCTISQNKISHNGTGNPFGINLATCGSTVAPNIVSNNFVSVSGGGSGISLVNCQNLNLIHNSVNQTGTGTALSYTNVTNSVNKNNIYNNLSGYCIKSNTITSGMNSNYNCIYSPINKLYNIGASTYSTIALYNVASGQDANSISADPLFTSNTDLHVTNSAAIDGTAQFDANVTVDIEGELRNVSTPDIGADEFVLSNIQNDAQVLNAYASSTICGGSQIIYAKIKNIGITNLTSITLAASGNVYSLSPITVTCNLAQGQTKDSISIGIFPNIYGNSNIKIYSFNPNTVVDQNLINDTLMYQTPNLKLNGTYTIGGANPDFANLRLAKNALFTYGICGPITFNIRPGTYQDTLTIPSVVGSSTLNTITFQSENGDSTSVIISDFALAPVSYPHYIVRLNNLGNVIFSKLTFKQLIISNSSFYAQLILIKRGSLSSNAPVTIKNCRLLSNSFSHYSIYEDGTSFYNINTKITNNYFFGGMSSIYLFQGSTGNSSLIKGNVFDEQTSTSIYLRSLSGSNHLVEDNIVKSFNLINKVNIITQGNIIIRRNIVKTFNSTAVNGSGALKLYNNYFLIRKITNSNINAFYFEQLTASSQIVNNTIRAEMLAVNHLIYLYNSTTTIKNNIIDNPGNGKIYDVNINNNLTITNNRYGSFGTQFGSYLSTSVTNLQAWKTLTGFDANSQNQVTYFLNDTTYKLIGDIDANGTAISYTNITTDIEQNTRSITNPDMGAYEFNLNNNDVGIVRYINPTDSVLCTGNNSINVVLRNYGSQALSNCNINWKVNNVLQTPFNWTGNLASGDSATVNIGSINLAGGQTHRFIVYTSNPNGTTDVSNFNDTIKTQYFKTRLSGIYTIGGNSPSYNTLKQATDSLQRFGVCGPVIYNIRDGSYYNNIKLYKFQGSSKTNIVTFQSESLDSSLVILSDTSNINNVLINTSFGTNASNIVFNKISFFSKNKTYSLGFIDNIKNIKIQNCIFDHNNLVTENILILSAVGDSLNGDFIISNNNFKNNSRLNINCSTNYPSWDTIAPKRVIITNNNFSNNGINIDKIDSIIISNNTLGYLHVTRSHQEIEISNNKIISGYFNIEKCNGKTNNVKFYNNIFDSTKIQFISVPNFEFFHNTVKRVNNSGYSSLIEVYGGLINQKIKNNIFYNSGFGSIYGVSDQLYANPVANKNFDYNIIYSPNDTIILKYSLFLNHTNWQNLYRQDEHSLFIKPTFAGPHDFHIINDHQLNNIGTNSLTSSLDFDKVTRNTSAPDIGAYEFNGVSTTDDAGILNVVNNASNCDHTNSPLTINLKNYGVNNLTSVTIKWQLNGIAQTDFIWTGNLPSNTFTTVTIGTYTNQTGNGVNNLIAFTTLPNGNSDAYVNNDSLITNLGYPMLNGIYTVGGFGADFNNLDDVINGLNQYGICGPVVFKFNPGGYVNVVASNSIIISGIHGNNSQNSITFESANGNNASAVIKGSVVLSYVKSITFKNMTFLNNSILLSDSCRSITFVGNNILRDSTSGYTSNSIYSGKYVNDLKIINNTFKHIASSFIYTNFAGNSQKIIVKGNYFYNANKTALYFTAADSLVIDSNIFYNTNTSTDSYRRAIAVSMLNGRDLKISRNVIKGKFNAGIYAGMGWPYSSGICRNCFIENNSIIAGPIGSSVGLLYCSADSMNVFYNSVKSNSAGSPPLYVQGNNVKVKNNVLYAIGSQCASLTSFTNTISDYNVYFTTGTILLLSGTNSVTSLSTYSASTGNDVHSIVADPQFINLNTDLHYQNTTLNGIATPIASVLFDQQGIARNPSIPNPGAYETLPDTTIDLVSKQLILKSIDTQTLIVGTTNLIKTTIFYSLPSNIDTSTYKFRGTIDSLRIHYQVNHQPEVIEKWNGTLNIGDSLKYTFTNPFFVPNGKLYDIKVWFENLNPNNVEYNSLDDSLRKEVALPMQGDYTMGGTLPDFPGLYYSNYSLQKCGTVGNVRFLMRAGHYGMFSCSSGTNTTSFSIEFRPESGNLNDVSVDMNYVLGKFKLTKIRIKPALSPSVWYGPFDGMQTSGSGMSLDSCLIRGGSTPTSKVGFHYLQTYSGCSATITNCKFVNLRSALHLSSHQTYYGTTSDDRDFVFENNIIDSCDYGIVIFSFPSSNWMRIKNNTINTYSTSLIIGSYSSSGYPGKFEISENNLKSTKSCGISHEYGGKLISNELVFNNNFVCGGAILPIGKKLKIFNNSFNSKATIVCLDTSYVYNNIFYNYDTTGSTSNWSGIFYHIQALELSYVPGKMHSDNNNIYAPTAGAKAWYKTLTPVSHTVINTYTFSNVSQINTITGLDSNSVSFPPLFVSSTDLHSQSAYMKNMGKAIATLATDIDGDERPAGPLDIGADEIQIPFTGVWPGDANGDMQVTSQDLYSVGLHYDYHGYQRDSISNTFVGQLCNDWNLAQIGNSIDMKYADCNGDSLIDMNDTMAIHLNYNLTHIPKLNSVSTSSITDIYLSFNKSLYLPGDTVKIDIAIGKFDNIQNNFYGGGFKLLYEPDKVKPNSEKMTFINSWVGNINSTKLKFSEINHAQGLLDAAVVRTTHTTINGYGKIGTFEFVLNDIVGSDKMHINVIDGNKVYGNGVITPIMSGIDSIPIVPNNIATSVDEIISDKVSIYPNPATDFVKIDFLSKVVDCKLELISIDGKVVITDKIKSNVHLLNLSGIAKGIYTLKLKNENGVSSVYKLVIQ